jgi:hypothetical protein
MVPADSELHARRDLRGYRTWRTFAAGNGINRITLWRALSGRPVRRRTVDQIAKALGITTHHLLRLISDVRMAKDGVTR